MSGLLPVEAAGIPVVDLTALLDDLGAQALRLRSQAAKWRHNSAVMARQAEQLTIEADYLHNLADTLRGGTSGSD